MASISLKYKSKSGNLTAPAEIDLGAMIPLATTTLSTSTSAITFTNIPTNYEHLQVRFMLRGTNADANIDVWCWLNNDTSTANYTSHFLRGNGATASASGSAASISPRIGSVNSGGSGANMFGVGIVDILDYANTNKYTTMRSLTGEDENGGGNIFLYSSLWLNAAAVTSIKLEPQATNNLVAYSTAALYGIKRAGA